MIKVKVVRMPGRICEVEVAANATINDALFKADMRPDGWELRLNGETAQLNSRVSHGDTVMMVQPLKGN